MTTRKANPNRPLAGVRAKSGSTNPGRALLKKHLAEVLHSFEVLSRKLRRGQGASKSRGANGRAGKSARSNRRPAGDTTHRRALRRLLKAMGYSRQDGTSTPRPTKQKFSSALQKCFPKSSSANRKQQKAAPSK